MISMSTEENVATSSPESGGNAGSAGPQVVSPSAAIHVPSLAPPESDRRGPSSPPSSGRRSDTSAPSLPNRAGILVVATVFAGAILFALFGDLSGSVGSFVLAGLEVFLFVFLAMTAYLAEDFPRLKVPAVLLLFLLIGGTVLLVAGAGVVALLPPDAVSLTDPSAPLPDDIVTPETALRMAGLFAGVSGAALVSCIGFFRGVRVRLARFLPFDPDSFVHCIALVAILSLTLIPLVPLVFLDGPVFLAPVFLEMETEAITFMDTIAAEIYSLLWTIGAAFLVAGLFIRRDVRGTCRRLGLTRPSARDLGVAVGLGLVLVGVFAGVDFVITRAWEFLGWQTTDMDAVELLFTPLLTPAGIVVASIAAGFGEELSIRGVLQPRFGILLPSLLFAALHAFQYNWDGVISVFLAGIVFALIRRHYSTTVSAVTHTVYDLVLFSALLFGPGI